MVADSGWEPADDRVHALADPDSVLEGVQWVHCHLHDLASGVLGLEPAGDRMDMIGGDGPAESDEQLPGAGGGGPPSVCDRLDQLFVRRLHRGDELLTDRCQSYGAARPLEQPGAYSS